MTVNFKITNLTCDACIKISSIALKKIPGVKNVEIKQDGQTAIESDREIAENEIEKSLSAVDKTASFN